MYYRNRYYHTVFGRFVTRDPIGDLRGSPNSYAVFLAPTNAPPGQWTVDQIKVVTVWPPHFGTMLWRIDWPTCVCNTEVGYWQMTPGSVDITFEFSNNLEFLVNTPDGAHSYDCQLTPYWMIYAVLHEAIHAINTENKISQLNSFYGGSFLFLSDCEIALDSWAVDWHKWSEDEELHANPESPINPSLEPIFLDSLNAGLCQQKW